MFMKLFLLLEVQIQIIMKNMWDCEGRQGQFRTSYKYEIHEHFSLSQLIHSIIKVIEFLKLFKIIAFALTYFGSGGNHHQGAVLCLAKTAKYGESMLVDMDVVNILATCQPVVQAYGSEWREEFSIVNGTVSNCNASNCAVSNCTVSNCTVSKCTVSKCTLSK